MRGNLRCVYVNKGKLTCVYVNERMACFVNETHLKIMLFQFVCKRNFTNTATHCYTLQHTATH